jgi:glycosyltransferase 2 family protein
VRKLLVLSIKFGLSLAILAYLLWRAAGDQAFTDLLARPKAWHLLAAGALACLANAVLLHARWYYLVRALGVPFTLKEAFRLGFLGYLFNLAPTGIVGGDLIKAVMLMRQSPGNRAKAVASVLVDRVIGLYMLFVLATVMILVSGFWRGDAQIFGISIACVALTAIGAVCWVVLFLPGRIGDHLAALFGRIPRVGPSIRQLIDAVLMYRHQQGMLALTTAMSLCVHLLFVLTIHWTAMGLYQQVPSLTNQLIVVPVSAVTCVIPLPLGPFEAVLEFLYMRLGMIAHEGLIVALAYRIYTVLIATVGMAFYLGSQGEVARVIGEVRSNPSLEGLNLAVAKRPHAA